MRADQVGSDTAERMRAARLAAEGLARQDGEGARATLAMWQRILDDPLLDVVRDEGSPGYRRWWVHNGRIVLDEEQPDPPSPRVGRGETEDDEEDADDPQRPPTLVRPASPDGAERLPGVMPVPLSRFIGRERELTNLRERVRDERLITISGSGGSGKTRLVHEFMRSFDERDDVLMVDLSSVPDAALVAQEVATALGRQEGAMGTYTASVQQTGVPFEERLAESLGDRRLLLVLDGCERVVNACADLVKVLLDTCPNLHVICASRTVLDLAGERVYRLPSLGQPPRDASLSAEELLTFEAVALFLDRARAKRPDLPVGMEDLEVIAEICRGLDGIPYAIELVAARVDVLSLRDILERLDQQLDWLQPGSHRIPARQRTMHAMIDWSHADLPAQEQALLRRLAVFRGGFTLRACEEVCAFDGLERATIVPLLRELVGKSLVETKPVGGDLRYWLLETIRRFAFDRSAEAGEDRAIMARHRRWCVDLAERSSPHLLGPDQSGWLDELERELENLRAALQPVDTEGADERLRLAASIAQFLLVRGHLSEGSRHLERALAENPAPSTLRATALSWSSEFAISEGRLDDAHRAAQQALVLSRRHHNRGAEARALRTLGLEALRRQQSAAARQLLLDSRHIFESIEHPPATGFTDIYLGKLAESEGDISEARRCYERAERTSRDAQRPWTLAWALLPLGDLDVHENAFKRADARLNEVLGLGRRINSRQLIVLAHLYLGNCAYRRDDQDLAGARYNDAMQAMERLDEDTSLVLLRASMARVAVARGDLDAAERWLRLLDWRDPLLRLPARAQILRSLSLYLAATDEVPEAEHLQREALAVWLRMQDHRQMLDGLERLAVLMLHRDGLQRAGELLMVTSVARERWGIAPPPVYQHEIEAVTAVLEVRQATPVPSGPIPSLVDAVAQEVQQAPQA